MLVVDMVKRIIQDQPFHVKDPAHCYVSMNNIFKMFIQGAYI